MSANNKAVPQFDLDYVNLVSGKAVTWIASADAKATALVTLLAVVLSLVGIGASQKESPAGIALQIIFVLFVLLAVCAAVVCLVVILPRTSRKEFLPGEVSGRSPTFFSDLATLSFQKFSEICAQPDREQFNLDAVEQAFILNRIAAKKMRAMHWAVWLTIISLFALAIMVLTAAGVLAR